MLVLTLKKFDKVTIGNDTVIECFEITPSVVRLSFVGSDDSFSVRVGEVFKLADFLQIKYVEKEKDYSRAKIGFIAPRSLLIHRHSLRDKIEKKLTGIVND